MVKIVTGVGANKKIIEAAKKANFPVILVESEEKLLEMLLDPEIDAVVRGSLNASAIMNYLRNEYEHTINRASFIKIDDHKLLLAPVGIDEGKNIAEKLLLVDQCSEFLKKIGKRPKIAIISGGRSQDRGRSPQIDQSINDGEKLASIIKDKYLVKHYYILIEQAIKDKCNLILAPDGISGNLIFRSLVLIASLKSYGAITLGIDKIFIDTSREQNTEGYLRALNFAHYLTKI